MKIKTSIAVLTGCLTIFFFLMLPVFLSMKEQKDQSVAAFKGSDFELKDMNNNCLLYTSDAADDTPCVDLGGRRIIKKKSNLCRCFKLYIFISTVSFMVPAYEKWKFCFN